jgi:hypothetical protein
VERGLITNLPSWNRLCLRRVNREVTVQRIALASVVLLLLTGCFGASDASDTSPAATTKSSAAVPASPKNRTAEAVTCPLTVPNGAAPRDDSDAGMNHGNGRLWTALWPHNVVIATPAYQGKDGAVGMKWPWWRGVRGTLTIEGRRLDGKAPSLRADIPDGYGDKGFQPSGIHFPTEGCWKVTGTVGNAKLTFVTLILRAARYRPMNEAGA